MSAEVEPGKFSRGESIGRPIGGNVAEDPFAKALTALAKRRGYESQMSLAQKFGSRTNGLVSNWYSARSKPDTEHFSALLRFLKPNDDELDALVEPWRQNIREKIAKKSKRRREKWEDLGPLNRFFAYWMESRKSSIREMTSVLGIGQSSLAKLSFSKVVLILEKGPHALELTSKEMEVFTEVMVHEVQERLSKGQDIEGKNNSYLPKRAKQDLDCKTYTQTEAAKELNISPERVRQLRRDDCLPRIITEEQLEKLKNRQKISPAQIRREVREVKVEYLLQIDPRLNYSEIANILGVKRATIAKDVSGLISENRLFPRGEMLRGKIKELREQGKTNEEIMNHLDISKDKLAHHLSKLRREGELPTHGDVTRRKIKTLCNSGKTNKEIMNELNFTQSGLSYHLRIIYRKRELEKRKRSS